MNMTPMIDVVFQLLIFFMVGSQMSEAAKERIPLPKQAGEEQRPTLITINIDELGRIIMDGETVSLDGMVIRVAAEVARQGNDPRRVQIALRADERVRSGAVSDVTNALARLRVSHVNIAVESPGS